MDARIRSARELMGNRLRRLREEAGLSVSEIARRAKVHRTYVHGIETGTENFTIDVFAGLLSACGVALDEFLAGLRENTLNEQEQEFHRMLSAILNSGNAELIQGIRINLEAITEKAIRLQKARASPRPDPGREAGAKDSHAAGRREERKPRKSGT